MAHIPAHPELALARAFSRKLAAWLNAEELATVRDRNASLYPAGSCASHDFCDANEAMEQAFRDVFGRDSYVGDDTADRDWDIIADAWTLAKAAGFDPAAPMSFDRGAR